MSIAIRPARFSGVFPQSASYDARPRPVRPPAPAPGQPGNVDAVDNLSRTQALSALRPRAGRVRSPAEQLLRSIQTATDADELTELRARVEQLPDDATRSHLLAACNQRGRALAAQDRRSTRDRVHRARAEVAALKSVRGKNVTIARRFERTARLLESLPVNEETAALKREFLDTATRFFEAHAGDDSITLTRTQLLRPIRQSMAQVLRSDPQGIMKAYTGELDPEADDARYTEVSIPLARVMQAMLDDNGTVGPFGDEQKKIDAALAATMAELVKAGDARFMTLVSACAQAHVSIAEGLADADQKARDRLSATLGLALHGIGGGLGVHGWKALVASGVGHELLHHVMPEGPDRFGKANDDIATLMGRAHQLLDLFRAPERQLDRAVNDRVSALRDGVPGAKAEAEKLATLLRARLQEIDNIAATGVEDRHLRRALERERESVQVALGSLDAATGADRSAPGAVERANELVSELARIDRALAGANEEEAAALRVQRLQAQLELRRTLPRLRRTGDARAIASARAALSELRAGDANPILTRLNYLEGEIHDSEQDARRDALITEARGLLDLLEMEIADIESLVAGERARREGAADFAGDDAFLPLGHLQMLQAEALRLRYFVDDFGRVSRMELRFG